MPVPDQVRDDGSGIQHLAMQEPKKAGFRVKDGMAKPAICEWFKISIYKEMV
jgi:hypothetical protein